jgi:hypothetical protein
MRHENHSKQHRPSRIVCFEVADSRSFRELITAVCSHIAATARTCWSSFIKLILVPLHVPATSLGRLGGITGPPDHPRDASKNCFKRGLHAPLPITGPLLLPQTLGPAVPAMYGVPPCTSIGAPSKPQLQLLTAASIPDRDRVSRPLARYLHRRTRSQTPGASFTAQISLPLCLTSIQARSRHPIAAPQSPPRLQLP